MTPPESPQADIASLIRRIEVLEAEADIRRLQARYMFLCDTPNPEFGCADDEARIDLILALYAEDAIWEGVGEYYEGQFGRAEGTAEIRKHFYGFWGAKNGPSLILNCHYLTSEQIHVHPGGTTADGQWVHMQPWLYSDGKAFLRSSRLNNTFRKEPCGTWKITRTRTENLFIAPLLPGWASDYPSKSVLMQPS